MATQSGKRPFWMHQVAEYIVAAVFVAQGLQSKTPAIPSVLGGLVLLNSACTKGPAAAFRLYGRKLHRLLDLVLIALIVVMAVQPAISLDNNTRVIMGVLAFVIAFVWMGSDFNESVPREKSPTLAAGARVIDGLRQAAATKVPAAKAPTANAPTAKASGAKVPTTSRPASTTEPTASTVSTSAGSTKPATGSRAEDVGRSAGRLAGKGVNIYRQQAAKRRKK